MYAMNEKLLLFQNEKNANYQPLTRFNSVALRVQKFAVLLSILSISAFGFGQTGPAGVNGGIRLWLDASDLDGDGIVEGMSESGVAALDSTVTEWRDKSGAVTESTHFTLPTPSALFSDTPRYRPLEPNFDGVTAVEFSPNSALYHDLTTPWSGAHTVFIVFKQKVGNVGIGTSVFSSGIDATDSPEIDEHFRISSDSATGNNYAYYTSSGSTGTAGAATATECNFGLQSVATDVVFYTATRSVGNSVTTYVNGTSANTEAFSTDDGNVFDQYILNANRDTTLLNNCYIAEVIIYNIVLTGPALKRIHDYLNCKYITTFAGPAPGGIDPCNVSLWLKADVATTDLGPSDKVNDWYDQSAYGFDGSETGGNRPTHIASDNNFNASINFDGTSDHCLNIGNSLTSGNFDELTMGSNDFSFYSVASVVPSLSGTLFADNLCTTASGYRIRYSQSSGEWKFKGEEFNTIGSVSSAEVATDTADTPYSLISFKRAGVNHTIQTHDGGASTVTSSPAVALSLTTAHATETTERWVGKRSNNGCGHNYYDGNISEIILVRSTVSADEDKKIQSYLGLKYGLTIPSSLGNYLAGNGMDSLWTFTSSWNDVAGLGQDTLSTLDQRVAKSQHPSALITMSTSNDFTSVNDTTRAAVGHGSYLVWGNNNVPATNLWTLDGAPNNYAMLPTIWRVKKTGTPANAFVRIDVDNPNNDVPDFVGDLYLIHGPDLSTATPILLTESSTGIWETSSAINFADSAFFTFAVRNDLSVEFNSDASASIDEETMGTFPDVIGDGIVNVASSIDITVAGGSATNTVGGPDYTYSNETVDIDTGTYTMHTFTLDPPTLDGTNQDLIDEGLETAIFNIGLGSGIQIGDVDGSLGALQVHTMTITDDDSYQIQITNPVDGAEPGTDVTFDITMAGGAASNTSGADITGTITFSGTAIEGTDYLSVGATTFTIPDSSSSPATITLTVSNDALLEGTETIIATIASANGAVPVVASDTADIIDDEETSLEISIGSPVDATVEDGGTISFAVSLSAQNQTGGPITGDVTYTTGAGMAIEGTDFGTMSTFSIPNGASVATISTTAIGDDLVEPTEAVIAILSNPSIGAVHATLFTDTAYIFDEDSANLEISITAPVPTVVENFVAGSFDYLVEMDDGKINATGGDIVGTITLTGTATPSPSVTADYTNITPFSFAIPDGSGSTTVSIDVVNDTLIEPLDTVVATVSGLSHGVPDAINNSATVSIIDDDAGNMFISIGSPTDTTEGPASPELPFISFEVFIEGGTLNTTENPITGNISYSGTATDGTDYTSQSTFSIPVNQNSVIVELDVIDNGATEPSETVTAALNGVPSTGSYANITTTMNIHDDDASNLTISVGSAVNGAEGGGNPTFTVFLDDGDINGTGTPITGAITYGGDASAVDFSATPPAIFSIPNGSTETVVTLNVLDDQVVEGTEDLIAIISSPSVGSVSGDDSTTVNIADNDDGALIISISAPVDGTEGGGDVEFLITMEGSLTNGLGQDLTGTVTFGGTATPSSDFVADAQFAIPDGSGFVVHSLSVLNDLNIEFTESLIASISNPIIGSVSTSDTATAYIFDNDSILTEVIIQPSVDGVELPIGSINGEFTVSLSQGLVNELGVDITGTVTLAGTATGGGTDYTGVFDFAIPTTTGSTVLTMTVVDDVLEETDETVIATISNPSIGVVGPMNSATIKIFDDDTDIDNDGLPDLLDPNIGNIDSDCDGIFDGCDVDANGDLTNDDGGVDLNFDGIVDVHYYPIPLEDEDVDGIHDGCDSDVDGDETVDNGPDSNADGLNDNHWSTIDNDLDLLPDHVDPNDNNIDSDGDGITDGADADVNGDGILDNGCDDDGDGIHNEADADYNSASTDADGDGIIAEWDMNDITYDGQQINYIVSPNGDGVNETLIIQGIQVVEDHVLTIYNRFGDPIYIEDQYDNTWAGEVNSESSIGSKKVKDGVYYYTLEVEGNEAVRGYIEIRN